MIGRCGDTAGDGEGATLIAGLVGWDLGVAAVDGEKGWGLSCFRDCLHD